MSSNASGLRVVRGGAVARHITTLAAGGALLLSLVAARPASANLITNGGFEDPPYISGVTQYMPGWDIGATAKYTNVYKPAVPDGNVHSGAASYKTTSGVARVLSQTFSTGVGSTYAVSFWVRNTNLTSPATVLAFYDGVPGELQRTSKDVVLSTTLAANSDWTFYRFNMPVSATASEAFLEIQLQQPLAGGALYMDDVTVWRTPEPGSMALIGAGVALAAVGRRRRRKVLPQSREQEA